MSDVSVVTLKVSDTPPMVSVAFVVVEELPDETSRTATVSLLLTVPLAFVYALPLMEYVPPVIAMFVAVLMPDTIMEFDSIIVFNVTPVRSVKVNWTGVVSGGGGEVHVVTLKVLETPPMVRVAFVVVEMLADEANRTATVSLLLTVPLALVYDPRLMEYKPPVIEMAAAVLIPETVMVFDVTIIFGATPVLSTKAN